LRLLGRSPDGILGLTRNLPGLVGGLTRNLSSLIGRLTCRFLGLSRRLSGGVLHALGRSLRDLLYLLLGLLGGFVHRVLDARILGRLIHGALELHVGVDHLLDLGLRIAVGELLGILLQLLAVILDLALDPAH
jgi:hypothetical protein